MLDGSYLIALEAVELQMLLPKCGRLAGDRPRSMTIPRPASHMRIMGRLCASKPLARSSPSMALRPRAHARRGAVQVNANFFNNLFKKDPSEATKKKYQPLVDATNALEPTIQSLDDAGLRAKTIEFKKRLAGGETLEDIMPEAFAVRPSLLQRACQPAMF